MPCFQCIECFRVWTRLYDDTCLGVGCNGICEVIEDALTFTRNGTHKASVVATSGGHHHRSTDSLIGVDLTSTINEVNQSNIQNPQSISGVLPNTLEASISVPEDRTSAWIAQGTLPRPHHTANRLKAQTRTSLPKSSCTIPGLDPVSPAKPRKKKRNKKKDGSTTVPPSSQPFPTNRASSEKYNVELPLPDFLQSESSTSASRLQNGSIDEPARDKTFSEIAVAGAGTGMGGPQL